MSKKYYEGYPLFTDGEFDALADRYSFDQLGSTPVSDKRIQHPFRMYSLDKFYKNKDTPPFDIHSPEVIVTDKLDGAAVAAYYLDGIFIMALSRGDGILGEDITTNISTLVPKTIENNAPGIIQLVGEVVAPATLPNARNYAAGALFLKDVEEFRARNLHFVVHDIRAEEEVHPMYDSAMRWCELQGLRTVTALGAHEYPTDGIVVRYNSYRTYNNMGYTAKHPRGAFCVKDPNAVPIVETVLRNVHWQVGVTGKVTPVATFDPVDIEGASVSRATLHNAGFIEEMDLSIGDTVLVTRRGGVIPAILGKV